MIKIIIGVKELSSQIESKFNRPEFSNIDVQGELSEYIISVYSHVYFKLKEANSVINCILFENDYKPEYSTIAVGTDLQCKGKVKPYTKNSSKPLNLS